MSKQVIVFPRGQLSSKDKERLTKFGVLAVEADDPSKVVTVLPIASVNASADDWFLAALLAVSKDDNMQHLAQSRFVAELNRRLLAREAKKGAGE